jgi:pimeloyl-ACP methyl ester carboxylesterase
MSSGLRLLSGRLALFFILAMAQLGTVFAQEAPKTEVGPKAFVGDWKGTLDVGSIKLDLILHIALEPDGKTLSGTMDSPDQGASGLKLDSVTSDGPKFSFVLKRGNIVYAGNLNGDGTKMSGTFTQGSSLPLDFSRATGPIAAKTRPQDPKKPYPYKEEDVSFENPAAKDVKLAGTLTLPADAKGPVPVVVLITGSGPQNRDEFLLGHRPFLVLADHLTRNGIAVLRYDDRGVAKSTGNFPAATSADFATDVEAAVAFLKTRKEIDPKRIGLIGHSEGGLVAPMVAARSKDVAFIVLMAGPGTRGDEILVAQGALIAKAEGMAAAAIERNTRVQKEFFNILLAEPNPAEAEKKMKAAVETVVADVKDEKKREEEAKILRGSIGTLNTPWFRFFLAYDPRAALQKLKIPVLAINGSLDLQVPCRENLGEIEKALKAGGNRNFKTVELPNLNHLFQTTKTGAPSEYKYLEETIAPVALETMSEWLKVQTGLAKPGKAVSGK